MSVQVINPGGSGSSTPTEVPSLITGNTPYFVKNADQAKLLSINTDNILSANSIPIEGVFGSMTSVCLPQPNTGAGAQTIYGKQVSQSSTTYTVNTGSTGWRNSGDTGIIYVMWSLGSGTISSVSGSVTGSWTAVSTGVAGTTGTYGAFSIGAFYNSNVTAGSETITVTMSGSGMGTAWIMLVEATGLVTSTGLDAAATWSSNSATNGGSLTTSNANDLLIDFAVFNTPTITTAATVTTPYNFQHVGTVTIGETTIYSGPTCSATQAAIGAGNTMAVLGFTTVAATFSTKSVSLVGWGGNLSAQAVIGIRAAFKIANATSGVFASGYYVDIQANPQTGSTNYGYKATSVIVGGYDPKSQTIAASAGSPKNQGAICLLAPFQTMRFVSDGASWYVVGDSPNLLLGADVIGFNGPTQAWFANQVSSATAVAAKTFTNLSGVSTDGIQFPFEIQKPTLASRITFSIGTGDATFFHGFGIYPYTGSTNPAPAIARTVGQVPGAGTGVTTFPFRNGNVVLMPGWYVMVWYCSSTSSALTLNCSSPTSQFLPFAPANTASSTSNAEPLDSIAPPAMGPVVGSTFQPMFLLW